jgi:hypothetical protein
LELIDKLVSMSRSSPCDGELWKWSISDKEGFDDWHEAGAILLLTLNRRALAERALNTVERFCRNVVKGWDTGTVIDDSDSVVGVTEEERRRIVSKLSRRAFREYMDRVVPWIMHADHMLREAALSIAHTANEDLLRVHRRTLTGEPGASNFWLEKKNVRDWLMELNERFLTQELQPLKPRFKKKGDVDEDLALWRFVSQKREELKKAGVKYPDREACRLARERFRIVSYDLYKRKKGRGKRVALGLVGS